MISHLWLIARLWGIVTFIAAVVFFLVGSSQYNTIYLFKFRGVQIFDWKAVSLDWSIYVPVGLSASNSYWLANAQNAVISPTWDPAVVYCGQLSGLDTSVLQVVAGAPGLPANCHALAIAKPVRAWQLVRVGRNLSGTFHSTNLGTSLYPAGELSVLAQALFVTTLYHGYWITVLVYFLSTMPRKVLTEVSSQNRPVTINVLFLVLAIAALAVAIGIMFAAPSIFFGLVLASLWLSGAGVVIVLLSIGLVGYALQDRRCVCERQLRSRAGRTAGRAEEDALELVLAYFAAPAVLFPVMLIMLWVSSWVFGTITWALIQVLSSRFLPSWSAMIWNLLFSPGSGII